MSEDTADAILKRVLELGYLDDREYTLRRARLMAEKGYGDFSIRSSLEGLQLPDEMIEEAVSKVSKEIAEEERISMLMEKKKDASREKMIRFLAGRGFPYEKILNATGGDDR